MRTFLIPITLLAGACTAERELGTLSEPETAAVYATMKTRLQEVHSLVLSAERPPNEYEYGCTSGTIDLRISLDGELQPQQVSHAFSACELDSLTFDGTIYYRELDPCESTSGYAVTIGGRVEIAGSMDGFCYFDARDNCGRLSGHMCGFPAASLAAE